MMTRRTSLRSAAAVIGIGAAIAFAASTPAFAANEGTYYGNWGGCAATEEIQLHYVNGGYHDQMEFFPTGTGVNCLFSIDDANDNAIWTSTGAGSGWIDDGPGKYLCPQIHDKATGVLEWQGVCN